MELREYKGLVNLKQIKPIRLLESNNYSLDWFGHKGNEYLVIGSNSHEKPLIMDLVVISHSKIANVSEANSYLYVSNPLLLEAIGIKTKRIITLQRLLFFLSVGIADIEAVASDIHVHHLDLNTGNNAIDNLIALSREYHYKIHSDLERYNRHIIKPIIICNNKYSQYVRYYLVEWQLESVKSKKRGTIKMNEPRDKKRIEAITGNKQGKAITSKGIQAKKAIQAKLIINTDNKANYTITEALTSKYSYIEAVTGNNCNLSSSNIFSVLQSKGLLEAVCTKHLRYIKLKDNYTIRLALELGLNWSSKALQNNITGYVSDFMARHGFKLFDIKEGLYIMAVTTKPIDLANSELYPLFSEIEAREFTIGRV